jgi:RHS repeat-associated protein
VADLEALVEPTASGDPDSPLRWTSKSVRHLADALQAMGHAVSHRLVATLLHEGGYRLQANRKTREGPQHPDRDAQFRYITEQVRRFQRQRQPAISVDTKKKELVGDFKNPGREWRPKGQAEPVRVHDFLIPAQGKAIPYGVYDLTRDEGWVSVGIDHDTARFAVQAIRRWWRAMGRAAYPQARVLEGDGSPHGYAPAQYGPFGNGGGDIAENGPGYNGLQSVAGLVYMRNRWYDPNEGRFTQEDPIGYAGGSNLYAYVGNNPILYTDPFGLCPNPPCFRVEGSESCERLEPTRWCIATTCRLRVGGKRRRQARLRPARDTIINPADLWRSWRCDSVPQLAGTRGGCRARRADYQHPITGLDCRPV